MPYALNSSSRRPPGTVSDLDLWRPGGLRRRLGTGRDDILTGSKYLRNAVGREEKKLNKPTGKKKVRGEQRKSAAVRRSRRPAVR